MSEQVDIFDYIEDKHITTVYKHDSLREVIISIFKDFGHFQRKHLWFNTLQEKIEFLEKYEIHSRKKSDYRNVEIIIVEEK